MKTEVYQPNWSWNSDTDKWLRTMCIGRTLNFPCGMSNIGDVKADIDRDFAPNVVADLLDKKTWPWEDSEFDTVICDPPFSYYNKFEWIHNLFNLAKHRLILSTICYAIRPKSNIWKKEFYLTLQNGSNEIRHWQIFTKENYNLEGVEYGNRELLHPKD